MEEKNKYLVSIISADKDGKGVTYINNKIAFVEGALPGEECEVDITNEAKSYLFAKVVNIVKKAPTRIDSDCKYYPTCGGCDMRHMTYDLEKEIKYNKVKNTFEHLAKINITPEPIIGADDIYNYRNKVIIPFGQENNEIIAGMYKKKSHDIINIEDCLIEPESLTSITKIVKTYLKENNISIYDETTHQGIFRALMFRKTKHNDIMLIFIVKTFIDLVPLCQKILLEQPIKSFYLNVNEKKTNVFLGDKDIHIFGDDYIYEEILNKKFRVSPKTFLQINNAQTEKLYQKAIELLEPSKEDVIIDAYCGMGSITLNVAPYVKKVYGIEVVKEAIIDANINKELNNISNAEFICGKCEDEIASILQKHKIDAMIVDPPRKGCDENFLNFIKKTKIKKIVYISCNVSTQARDVTYLKDLYEVKTIVPTDLFPRSLHIENIALLELK